MPLTVTTWNVENFSSNSANFVAKRDHLVTTLQAINPDIVALQEILTDQALTDLAQQLNYHPISATPDGRGNRVGVLLRAGAPVNSAEITAWRLPPNVVINQLADEGQAEAVPQLRRPALQVTVNHQGTQITLITTHLKSKLLTFPGGHFSTTNESLRSAVAYFALQLRAAEARTLREHATDLLAGGDAVIVLGDFNDGPDAASTQIFYGPTGSQPRGPEDAGNANGAFQRTDANDPRRLFNVTKLAPENLRWSRRHNQQNELLDQVLASEALMPRVGNLRQVPTIDIRNADSPNLGDQPRDDSAVPDHAPVTAVFAM